MEYIYSPMRHVPSPHYEPRTLCSLQRMPPACFQWAVTCFLLAAGKVQTRSINSCLAPVGGLDGAAITTVEGIGNSEAGFHPIQGETATGIHIPRNGA